MLLAFRLQEERRVHRNEVKPNSHDFPTFQFNHHELYEYVQMFSDTFNIYIYIHAKHMSATVLHRRSLSLAAAAVTLAMRQKRPMQMWYQFISLDDER